MTRESQLVGMLGLSRNRLRELRQKILKKGEDWNFEKRAACYTHEAIEKIRAHVALPLLGTAPEPASALPEAITLLVFNPRLLNTNIILAYKPGTDPANPENRLRVRVRTNANFVRFVNGKPMELKARLLQADLYELVGQCPRRKGWIQPT